MREDHAFAKLGGRYTHILSVSHLGHNGKAPATAREVHLPAPNLLAPPNHVTTRNGDACRLRDFLPEHPSLQRATRGFRKLAKKVVDRGNARIGIAEKRGRQR